MLVCMGVLLATAMPPQPAQAFAVVDDAAVAAIVSAFLSSCGMTFSASGMDSEGVKGQVGRLIDQYLDTVMGGKSATEWFGDVAIGYNRGVMSLPAILGNKIADFATWVQGEYSVEENTQAVLINHITNSSVTDANGNTYYCYVVPVGFSNTNDYNPGTVIYIYGNGDKTITFSENESISFSSLPQGRIQVVSNFRGEIRTTDYSSDCKIGFYITDDIDLRYCIEHAPGDSFFDEYGRLCSSYRVARLDYNTIIAHDDQISIVPGRTIFIPQEIPDDKDVAITTGAAAGLSYDDMLDQILEAIAAGQLATTKEIVDAGTSTGTGEIVTPVDQTLPVVDELGLPSLGEALTTRFPFSIPWDVVRAIRLLAAPAKTPRYEVDFMAPIAYRFGGGLGDTTVVLDFEEYAIVGQLSRWTTTIGFCLLLASGTKKLIWTA